MAKVIFFSPHFDDVVLSCAGLLQRLKAYGDEVTVMTCFTVGGPDEVAIYRERNAEDLKALAHLGVKKESLGFTDAPFREIGKRRGGRLLFGSSQEDPHTLSQLKNRISQIISEQNPDLIFAPLGVGWHIDHLLTHDACAAICDSAKLRFYAEKPYSFLHEQLLLRTEASTPQNINLWAEKILNQQYVQTYLPSWTAQDFLEFFETQSQLGMANFVELETVELDQPEMMRAKLAVTEYRTQIDALFRSQAEIAVRLKENPERYFKLGSKQTCS